ncbi:hypothetical protein M441DRAFT_31722 [Trichoderma asperellum CBS 433.97]|uniref:nitrilase n=2 Tax=Trichoderma asperellum TaxID=101201 RepID=A0A2T3YTJ8_TRIA4|nr:hypothetical protein M441DRAFT_31722 [Trichoderma asperellum CBS 433.97]PTB35849.1 hypothetical protein M441DRAFT_31722 [Trichoderma asperellum CBS 433.97]
MDIAIRDEKTIRVRAVQAEPVCLGLPRSVDSRLPMKGGMFIMLGYSEREEASIYLAQAFISPDEELVHNRRKIKPTHSERTIWGEGQAESLKTVIDSPFDKIGGLNC